MSAIGLSQTAFEKTIGVERQLRKHCANRTHRLRSTLKMTHGKGREFKKLPPISLETIKEGQ